MAVLELQMISPCVGYLDELSSASALAPRPTTLEGKVVGLVPNWRPAAVHILTAIGKLLQERYHLKEIVLEPPVRISAMARGGKLLDGMSDQLDGLARRVDVALTATGD
ncbi:MAG: hypothetical protein EXR29_05225 [Betaproteobacteria bacterium]|nr:hypothetical protein [Betaproteobacteria bacterium]